MPALRGDSREPRRRQFHQDAGDRSRSARGEAGSGKGSVRGIRPIPEGHAHPDSYLRSWGNGPIQDHESGLWKIHVKDLQSTTEARALERRLCEEVRRRWGVNLASSRAFHVNVRQAFSSRNCQAFIDLISAEHACMVFDEVFDWHFVDRDGRRFYCRVNFFDRNPRPLRT